MKKWVKILLVLLAFGVMNCSAQGREEYKRIEEKRADLKENRGKIKNGTLAPDFALPGLDGTLVELNEYKGKYVLLDFWASWCVTCKKHNKRLIPVYERLKGKGFEILGVSLDRKEEAWKRAITKRGYPWPQVSDFKGIDSEVSQAYGIQYVPNFILVDPEGVIVKKYHENSIEGIESDMQKLLSEK